MKVAKIVGLVVAGVLAVIALGLAAILLFVDPTRYRPTIERQVTAATGRPFAIGGPIKLSVYPWIAVEVSQVSLGNPDGYGTTPQIAAERLRLGAKLLPLLGGHLEVSRVAIDGLAVTLVKRADGHTNWEDLGKGSGEPKSAAGGGNLADASLAGLDVTHATLTLRDEGEHSVTRIRDFELHTGSLGRSTPADLALGLRLDAGEGTPETRLDLKSRTTVDTDKGLATLADVKLRGERRPVAPGAPLVFSVDAPTLALDWKAGTLAPATLSAHVGDLALAIDLHAEQLFGERTISGHVRMAEQSLRKLAGTAGITLPATRDPNAFSRVALSSAFALHGRASSLDDLDVTLDRSRLRGRISLEGGDAMTVDADLHVDAIDLDGYRAPAQAPAAANAGAATPAKPAPLPVATLRALNGRARIAIDRATLAGLTLGDLRIPVTAHDGDLRLQPSATAFGGTAKADVHLDAEHDTAALTVAADVQGVDIGAVIRAYAKSDRLSGRANAQVRLAGAGRTDSELVDSMQGPINLDVRDGALEGIDVTYELERAQAALRGQAPPSRSGPARTAFSTLIAKSQLARGLLTTDPLQIETQVLRVNGKGTFRLADQAVDYQIAALVRQVPSSGEGSSLGSLKSLEVPITVTGTVRDYKLRPDVSGIVKGRVKQELESQKEKLRDSLKDKLKDLFH